VNIEAVQAATRPDRRFAAIWCWTRRRTRLARQVIVGALRESVHDRITTSAGSLAFHWFLAVFPATVAAIGLAGLVDLPPSDLHHLLHAIGVLLPEQVSAVLSQAILHPDRAAASRLELIFGIAVALWSTVEATAALQVGLDVACEVEGDRGFVGRRLMALPLVAATLVLGGSATVLLVLGDPVRRLLPLHVPLVRPAFDALWDLLRFGGSVLLVMILLSTYYSLGPRREHLRWRWISAGSITAGAGWLAASFGFAFYLDHFGHESRTYGAFAGVAVLALWLYLTAIAVLFGAELDTELARPRTAGDSAPSRRYWPAATRPTIRGRPASRATPRSGHRSRDAGQRPTSPPGGSQDMASSSPAWPDASMTNSTRPAERVGPGTATVSARPTQPRGHPTSARSWPGTGGMP